MFPSSQSNLNPNYYCPSCSVQSIQNQCSPPAPSSSTNAAFDGSSSLPPRRTTTHRRSRHNSDPDRAAAVPRPPPRSRHARSGSSASASTASSKYLFTPASIPPFMPAHPHPQPHAQATPTFLAKKSVSSPLLAYPPDPPVYSNNSHARIPLDSEDDRDDNDMIYTSWSGAGATVTKTTANVRTRIFGGTSGTGFARARDIPKTITTAPGQLGAGETETEADEPPRHLPTSRIIHSSGPLIPPNTLQQRLRPLLFECSRLLSIVPAVIGTLYNLYLFFNPPDQNVLLGGTRRPPERIDFIVSALWAILTGFQCLRLTTGLLTRWRLYYPPLSTLIRLIALQAICWPATHFTLTILEHEKRPVIVWAVVGTTTSISRSVQIWVTSNLWWERTGGDGDDGSGKDEVKVKMGYWKRWGGGKWGGRRWDWKEVGLQCVLPAGVIYVVMAWAEAFRREWSRC